MDGQWVSAKSGKTFEGLVLLKWCSQYLLKWCLQNIHIYCVFTCIVWVGVGGDCRGADV